MQGESCILVFVTGGTIVGWLFLVNRVWVGRKDSYLAARVPILICVISFGCLIFVLAVIIHWIMLFERRGLPCYVLFWPAYTSLATVHVPCLLRMVRLLVILDKAYRGKYARFVKIKNIVRMWATISLAIMVLAAVLFMTSPDHLSRDVYGCHFFDGNVLSIGTSLWLVTLVTLTRKLMRVEDAFNINRESIISSAGSAFFISPLVVTALLMDTGTINHTRASHRAVELFYAAALVHIFVWSTLVPVATHHRWRFCGGVRVVPAPTGNTVTTLSEINGALEYIREAETTAGVLFRTFCRQHMCMENWGFAVEAIAYEKVASPVAQYEAFCKVSTEFLRPSSPQEINISSKLQTHMLSFRKRETFLALTSDERRAVLEEPLHEVVLLLEQNLLAKFRQSLKVLQASALESEQRRRSALKRISQRLAQWATTRANDLTQASECATAHSC